MKKKLIEGGKIAPGACAIDAPKKQSSQPMRFPDFVLRKLSYIKKRKE